MTRDNRSGSLRALPNQPTRPIRRGSLLTSALGEAGAGREGGASPTAPPSPRPDRGLFLNLTGALFGEGKLQQVLSPTRTGDTFFSKTTPLSRAPSEKGRRKGSATPSQLGEDLFTQFSQYGSRAHLCQPDTEPSSVRKLSSEQPRHPEQRRFVRRSHYTNSLYFLGTGSRKARCGAGVGRRAARPWSSG